MCVIYRQPGVGVDGVGLTYLLTVWFTGDQVLEWNGVKRTYLLIVCGVQMTRCYNGTVKLTYLLTVWFTGDQVLE